MGPRLVAVLVLTTAAGLAGCGERFEASRPTEASPRTTSDWPEYGGGTGRRYVEADQIDRTNVDDLEVAWVYRTGQVSAEPTDEVRSTSAFELTPILAEGRLLLCTPFNDVIALDPLTGGELWRYQHHLDLTGRGPLADQLSPGVIAAGGHARMGSTMGDHLVAFALGGAPDQGAFSQPASCWL
jgi:quinoprotein glucose dehydrogenase